MQSQFTDKAQNALAQAGRCARSLKQGYIGTEHILVGLLKEESGVAAKVLMSGSPFRTETDRHRASAAGTDQRRRECCRTSVEHVGGQCTENICGYPDRHRTGWQSV